MKLGPQDDETPPGMAFALERVLHLDTPRDASALPLSHCIEFAKKSFDYTTGSIPEWTVFYSCHSGDTYRLTVIDSQHNAVPTLKLQS